MKWQELIPKATPGKRTKLHVTNGQNKLIVTKTINYCLFCLFPTQQSSRKTSIPNLPFIFHNFNCFFSDSNGWGSNRFTHGILTHLVLIKCVTQVLFKFYKLVRMLGSMDQWFKCKANIIKGLKINQ